MTDITIQYFDDCPNWRRLEQLLLQLKAGGADINLNYQIIDTPEKAERAGFRGSPSVLIDGTDPFANDGDPVGLQCRVYVTEDGYAPAPSLRQLEEAIANR